MTMTDDGATARCDDGSSKPDPIEKVRALLSTASADGVVVDEVVAVIADLVANVGALRRQLEQLGGKRFKTSEVVGSAQLRLLLAGLAATPESAGPDALREADEELSRTANVDALKREREKKKKKKRKRPAIRPFPANLRRDERTIPVPPEERACGKCGCERVCIGHDVTEELEREPAELIVRVNKREKLACKTPGCEGSVCRAPLPDKVVAAEDWACGWWRASWWTSTATVCRFTGRPPVTGAWVSICRSPPWWTR